MPDMPETKDAVHLATADLNKTVKSIGEKSRKNRVKRIRKKLAKKCKIFGQETACRGSSEANCPTLTDCGRGQNDNEECKTENNQLDPSIVLDCPLDLVSGATTHSQGSNQVSLRAGVTRSNAMDRSSPEVASTCSEYEGSSRGCKWYEEDRNVEYREYDYGVVEAGAGGKVFIHGNYHRYYGYRLGRAFDEDPRLNVLEKRWFAKKRCMDIGCNEGLVTLSIAKKFGTKSMTGIDLDEHLIKRACRYVFFV